MGETNRKGIIAAKVTMPTQPEPDDRSNTIHELATMVVHIAALEAMLASQVKRNSRWRNAANCGRLLSPLVLNTMRRGSVVC